MLSWSTDINISLHVELLLPVRRRWITRHKPEIAGVAFNKARIQIRVKHNAIFALFR